MMTSAPFNSYSLSRGCCYRHCNNSGLAINMLQ